MKQTHILHVGFAKPQPARLGAWDAALLAIISLVLIGIGIAGLGFAALVIWAIL